jgi:predicted GIY-YIG superfamily endonuclease
MSYIYIIHLDDPIAHARHYSGCTTNVTLRLLRHAQGHGSKLLAHARKTGVDWRLAAIFQVKEDIFSMRQAETWLKRQCHAPRYCPLCTYDAAILAGTTPISLALYKGPIHSAAIRAAARPTEEPHAPGQRSSHLQD